MSKYYRVHPPESLSDRIHLVLSTSPFLRGREVRFALNDSEVVLSGRVRSYFQKQMAQESLRGLEGLGTVRNEIAVDRN